MTTVCFSLLAFANSSIKTVCYRAAWSGVLSPLERCSKLEVHEFLVLVNTHSNGKKDLVCFCLAVSVDISFKKHVLPLDVWRRLFSPIQIPNCVEIAAKSYMFLAA